MPINTRDRGVLSVPKSLIFFAPEDGVNTDFESVRCYLGMADPFTANVTVGSQPEFSAECGVDEQIDDVETQISRTATLNLRNINDNAVAYFWVGDIFTMTQGAAVGATESLRLEPGKYYQLGVSDTFPTGARNLTNVTAVGLTENVDYEIDLLSGEMYVRTVAQGFTGTPGAAVVWTYDLQAATWPQTRTGRSTAYKGLLIARACNYVRGQPRDHVFPSTIFRPGGDHIMKQQGSTPTVMPFALSFLPPANGRAAAYIDNVFQ